MLRYIFIKMLFQSILHITAMSEHWTVISSFYKGVWESDRKREREREREKERERERERERGRKKRKRERERTSKQWKDLYATKALLAMRFLQNYEFQRTLGMPLQAQQTYYFNLLLRVLRIHNMYSKIWYWSYKTQYIMRHCYGRHNSNGVLKSYWRLVSNKLWRSTTRSPRLIDFGRF